MAGVTCGVYSMYVSIPPHISLAMYYVTHLHSDETDMQAMLEGHTMCAHNAYHSTKSRLVTVMKYIIYTLVICASSRRGRVDVKLMLWFVSLLFDRF